MATRHHPASVGEIDEALGTPGSNNASKKVAAAEELFDVLLAGTSELLASGRADRLRTSFCQRMRTIAALARNRPADEFERWLDTYLTVEGGHLRKRERP